jgi:hypothetical protein
MNDAASSLLLERLTNGSGPAPSMSEMLTQLSEGDPRMALLAKYFAQRETEQNNEDEDQPVDREERRESLVRLQRLMKRLYSELEQLRERNDSLAAALGACYLCWGEDLECEACGGGGAPGSSPPDEILLSHYVTPAIRRLRRTSAPRPASANGHSPNGHPRISTEPRVENQTEGENPNE